MRFRWQLTVTRLRKQERPALDESPALPEGFGFSSKGKKNPARRRSLVNIRGKFTAQGHVKGSVT